MMNSVLATWEFWQPYWICEPDDASKEDLDRQLDGLHTDYTVREKRVEYEYAGGQNTSVHRVVEFSFSCGDRFSLTIEYRPGEGGCEKNLFLVESQSGKRHQLGWWDLAQWHPYCLRADELDDLLEFWRRWDDRWNSSEIPVLLLGQFVGLENTSDLQTLQGKVDAACRAIGLSATNGGRPSVPLYMPDDHYRWEMDDELGWMFTSDEYGCYSIRNREHSESDEGRFPFVPFREMMAEVRERLRTG